MFETCPSGVRLVVLLLAFLPGAENDFIFLLF
jgi:hypothetical protein